MRAGCFYLHLIHWTGIVIAAVLTAPDSPIHKVLQSLVHFHHTSSGT